MTRSQDEEEHSLEMHLPYIYTVVEKAFGGQGGEGNEWPKLIPILVGNTDRKREKEYGSLLGKWLKEEENVFVVSSDFCHWGLRFGYTYYLPSLPTSSEEGGSGAKANGEGNVKGIELRSGDKIQPSAPSISESIGVVDKWAMDAIETGKQEEFWGTLRETGNTVCGRHPIGVVLAGLEGLVAEKGEEGKGKFKFVRYERSSDCVSVGDSSVSYASAYAVL